MEILAIFVFTAIVLFIGAIIYDRWYHQKEVSSEVEGGELALSEVLKQKFSTPNAEALSDKECILLDIAQAAYNLRERAGLSEQEVAALVGCTAKDIECLEETDDYENGCPYCLYRKIADAIASRSIPTTES